jgi:hypothetical protein
MLTLVFAIERSGHDRLLLVGKIEDRPVAYNGRPKGLVPRDNAKDYCDDRCSPDEA